MFRINSRPYLLLTNAVRFLFTRKLSSSSYIADFQSLIGKQNVLTTDLDPFNQDWLKSHCGRSDVVLLPRQTTDVSKILRYCNQNDLKCVVQSGNTSLVCGATPWQNEIIISMKKMNQIISFDEITGVLHCESGCILQNLEEFVQQKQRLIPYDLGAKGSCMIGGNLATNAGGLRFIKFGPLHSNVLGLEIVMANGEILDLMSSMRKDNTGYHLRHLFIGSEGTLGIITKVSILCPKDFKCKKVFLFSLENFNKLIELFQMIQEDFSENLSCFEMIDESSMKAVVDNLNVSFPLSSKSYPFYSLFELSSNDESSLDQRFAKHYEKLVKKSIILDGTYANDSDGEKFRKLKSYRETITEGLRIDGYSYKYDISLPMNVYYEVVNVMRKRLSSSTSNFVRICGYGHMGDGNMHFNVTSRQFDEQILNLIEPFLYEYVAKYNGSISAEHGIGVKKRKFLHYSKNDEAIKLMQQMKRMFDPKSILNPHVLF